VETIHILTLHQQEHWWLHNGTFRID